MIEIIPSIDLLNGEVVRLKKGDYNQVTSYGSPLDCAKSWLDQGGRRLHVVDLDGAKEGKLVNLYALEQILSTGIEVQFGGGIRSWESLEHLFELGVRLAILGTAAVKDPDLMIRALNVYTNRIILALDSRGGKVSVAGWLEDSEVTIEELLKQLSQYGLSRFIYTDISRDGLLNGPDITGAVNLCKSFPQMKCIISGGVSSIQDLVSIKEQSIEVPNLDGIISGKALYEKIFSLREALDVFAPSQANI
jgi:phosphoribosylformimino-5-aminoimidazole carboxamide ribotide isomerase